MKPGYCLKLNDEKNRGWLLKYGNQMMSCNEFWGESVLVSMKYYNGT